MDYVLVLYLLSTLPQNGAAKAAEGIYRLPQCLWSGMGEQLTEVLLPREPQQSSSGQGCLLGSGLGWGDALSDGPLPYPVSECWMPAEGPHLLIGLLA